MYVLMQLSHVGIRGPIDGAAFVDAVQECQNIRFEREAEVLSVSVEPGMMDGQARAALTTLLPLQL